MFVKVLKVLVNNSEITLCIPKLREKQIMQINDIDLSV